MSGAAPGDLDALATAAARHGGPDALGVPRHDFSTNANACGPAPLALVALAAADPRRYPDPAGTAVRAALGALHGVAPARIVLAASASEFIQRLSVALALTEPQAVVQVPSPGYGDYARAALAAGLRLQQRSAAAADHHAPAEPESEPALIWHTAPASPLGQDTPWPACAGAGRPPLLVVDCAYAPLRLAGAAPALPDSAWQLWSPNKALGLTGVRGAYAIVPAELVDGAGPAAALPARLLARLRALAPSWPLGAHAEALLLAWAEPAVQAWVAESRATLRRWKARQLDALTALGWQLRPSVTPFMVARAPDWVAATPERPARIARQLAGLRQSGIKLRDTASMGLPGWVRLSVQPPAAQDALVAALARRRDTTARSDHTPAPAWPAEV